MLHKNIFYLSGIFLIISSVLQIFGFGIIYPFYLIGSISIIFFYWTLVYNLVDFQWKRAYNCSAILAITLLIIVQDKYIQLYFNLSDDSRFYLAFTGSAFLFLSFFYI
jgi:hypothetical protein